MKDVNTKTLIQGKRDIMGHQKKNAPPAVARALRVRTWRICPRNLAHRGGDGFFQPFFCGSDKP